MDLTYTPKFLGASLKAEEAKLAGMEILLGAAKSVGRTLEVLNGGKEILPYEKLAKKIRDNLNLIKAKQKMLVLDDDELAVANELEDALGKGLKDVAWSIIKKIFGFVFGAIRIIGTFLIRAAITVISTVAELLIANPITAGLVLGVTAFAIYRSATRETSTVQPLFPSEETAKFSTPNYTPSKVAPADPKTILFARNFFIERGWTAEQASGIVGNLLQESGLNPIAFNSAGGGEGAQGIAQWRGPRIRAFRRRYGIDPLQASIATQLDFVNFELTQGEEHEDKQKRGTGTYDKSAGNALRAAQSRDEATIAVYKKYERAGPEDTSLGKRLSKAQYTSTVTDSTPATVSTSKSAPVAEVPTKPVVVKAPPKEVESNTKQVQSSSGSATSGATQKEVIKKNGILIGVNGG